MTYQQLLAFARIEHMHYGKERRHYIMHMFDADPTLKYAVNCKGSPQLKDDPDLRKLIKQNKLKPIRITRDTWYPYQCTYRITYLVKP